MQVLQAKLSYFRQPILKLVFVNRDEITAQWEESRKDMTAEFKRKHKSVTKKLSKLKKKGFYTEGKMRD